MAACLPAFALGSLLVIVFLFFPVIDRAKIARAESNISVGDNRIARQKQEAAEEIKRRKPEKPEADKINEKVLSAEDSWHEEKAKKLVDLDDLKANVNGLTYWYDWGMLIAFVLLALSSLGFIFFGQTTTIRIVGAVVIIAEIVLVLAKFISAAPLAGRLPGT